MNKKDLKMYEAPACEVVELDAKTTLLAGSGETERPSDDTIVPGAEPEGD